MASLPKPVDGDRNRASELDAVAWTWATLAAIFVSMRVYSRLRLTRNVWWDDYVLILTTLLQITSTVMWTILGANSGCRHLFYLTSEEAMSAQRLNWITQPFAIMALGFGKISVALSILRIMGQSFWRRKFLYFSMVSAFLLCGLAVILTYAQCKPVQALWIPDLLQTGKAKCWKPETQTKFSVFVGSWLGFLDLSLAVFAISIIVQLKLPVRQRAFLSSLFGFGIFAAICAGIKTSYLPSLNARSDLTWRTVDLWIWNVNECAVVIIAACIPTLRPICLILFRRPGRHEYLAKHKQGQTYTHVGRRGYMRSGSKKQGTADTYDSTTAIGEVEAHGDEASWLELGTPREESGDTRQIIDVRVERTDRKGNRGK